MLPTDPWTAVIQSSNQISEFVSGDKATRTVRVCQGLASETATSLRVWRLEVTSYHSHSHETTVTSRLRPSTSSKFLTRSMLTKGLARSVTDAQEAPT